mgnify:CR=1 FL=1|jgi:hypothetical protein
MFTKDNLNCNNLKDKFQYINSPCNKLQKFIINEDELKINYNKNTPLVINSSGKDSSSSSTNNIFSFFNIFNNIFSNNSFELSDNNNDKSFYTLKGFPVYLLIFITIIVNIFIAIILSPVIVVGIFIIIFLILILAMILLHTLTK